ncbi:hypothetical protein BDW59DRAFT_145341 [Aspergillus cavernicola]|uniref:F-box domain-containing protein n=1 Tax=Aspergillus cavernicola TaxID=176166 RepID=A0ABR4IEY8_9EURO
MVRLVRPRGQDPLGNWRARAGRAISQSSEEKDKWYVDLGHSSEDAWVALLLVSLPNLTGLCGAWAIWGDDAPWVTRILSRAAHKEHPFDKQPAFRRLTTLDILCNDAWAYCPTYQFLPFFHLPSLRSVSLEGARDYEIIDRTEDHPAMHPAPRTSPVETLTLDSLCNGRYGMTDLIQSCANLREFTCQHDEQVVWGELFSDFRPLEFAHPY